LGTLGLTANFWVNRKSSHVDRPDADTPERAQEVRIVLLAILDESVQGDEVFESVSKIYPQTVRALNLNAELIDEIASGRYDVLLVDCGHEALQSQLTRQIFMGISQVVPSVYFNVNALLLAGHSLGRPEQASFCYESGTSAVLECLESMLTCNAAKDLTSPRVIPIFDRVYAGQFLRAESSLSMLMIDAAKFRSIEASYGKKVYQEARRFLQDLLLDLWGRAGNFRARDILCKYTADSDVYLVLLEPNRSSVQLPPPGTLEKIADRVQNKIENAMWRSLRAPRGERTLPAGMTVIPTVVVGYGSATLSSGDDEFLALDELLGQCVATTRIQEKRLAMRRKEYLQNIISTEDALRPMYQGVFLLQKVTRQNIELAQQRKSIAPLAPAVYGFESLIRAQSEVISRVLGESRHLAVDPDLMTPDTMFNLAKAVGASLELDMAAMKMAVKYATRLPGKLMINILPRNFYHLRRMRELFPPELEPVFEVSESEAIENFDLVCEVRAELKRLNFGVATDDFGKDYGGLERIFKIQPDIIKLDRALIANIHKDPPRLAFLSGLVQSAKISRSLTLGEGVECWEEAEALKAIGVELVQGFLLHRPQSVDQILTDLSADQSADSVPDNVVRLKSASGRAS
jgi:EAL domain-containing protein (putative c-di-GMP-specific phosphodiesterase class I)/GGDEF domain-containing protein